MSSFSASLSDNVAKGTEHRLMAFIHDWFAFFDRMEVDPAWILSHLDETNMRMEFPGTVPIVDHDGFRQWWSSVLARYRRHSHHIRTIDITLINDSQYELVDTLDWQSETPTGRFAEQRVRHTLSLSGINGYGLKVVRYVAEPGT